MHIIIPIISTIILLNSMAIGPNVLLTVNYIGNIVMISAIIFITIVRTFQNNVDSIFLYINLMFCVKLYNGAYYIVAGFYYKIYLLSYLPIAYIIEYVPKKTIFLKMSVMIYYIWLIYLGYLL